MRLYEKKDHLIRKNPNLTDGQKQEIVDLLTKHPSSENLIDWTRNSKLTYEDFLAVLRPLYINDLDFRGLIEGEDYDLLLDKPNEKLYFIHTYNASKIIASNSVEPKLWTEIPSWCGYEEKVDKAHAFGHFDSEHGKMKPGAKWCISMQTSDKYWNDYSEDFYFIFWIRNKSRIGSNQKIALSIYKKNGEVAKQHNASDIEIDLELPQYIKSIINFDNLKEKEKQAFLSKLKLNPETERYDYDGNLSSPILKSFLLEDKDGFTINFGRVTGEFNCSNLGLTSLKGAPQEVGRDFCCYKNQLTSLKGAPQIIGKDFYCNDNQLISLKGAPQIINGSFICYNNQLTSLEGAPQTVEGNFLCPSNNLTSLEGAPREIEGDFYCHNNKLTSLEGAPQTIIGNFSCSENNLTSLEGAPQTVGGKFSCSNNHLTSLKGAPQEVGESFYCSNNQLYTLEGAPQEVGESFYCNNNQLTSLEGAPQIVGGSFYCRYNPNLHSLEGIGKVERRIFKDF